MPPPAALSIRFGERLRDLGLHGSGARVMVAVSGGADSVALLHLLRFAEGSGVEVLAAHADHAMRPGSDGDARWVAGLCAAWGIPLWTRRAEVGLRGEAAARAWRYAALREMMAQAGATHLATAHHADDQAETVLFRVLRGAGTEGLAGIPETGPGGLLRPLLPFWRRELRAYAAENGLRWRRDPSNGTAAYTRNRIRRLLPLLERRIAPGARRSLVRAAGLARGDEAAWDAVLEPLERACVTEAEGALLLVRSELAGYDSAVAARLLRRVLRRLGATPDAQGTRAALQFITAAPSGRTLELAGGLRIHAEFDVARLQRAPPHVDEEADRELPIAGASGRGTAVLAGREVSVAWRTGLDADADADGWADGGGVRARLDAALAPLVLRGWRAGDRIRTAAGTRKLKKLLGERRVPLSARRRLPVLATPQGRVLWAAGVAQDPSTLPREGAAFLLISIG